MGRNVPTIGPACAPLRAISDGAARLVELPEPSEALEFGNGRARQSSPADRTEETMELKASGDDTL